MAERNGLSWMNGIFVLVIGITLFPWTTSRSLFSSEEEPSIDYSGNKVIRVHPVTEKQRSLFQVYFDQDLESGVTLWTEPMRPDHSMDFQVTSEALAPFLAMLHAENISYDFLIDDLQRLIEEQKRESDEYKRGLVESRRRRRSIRLTIQRSEGQGQGPPYGPTIIPSTPTTTDQTAPEESVENENHTEDVAEMTRRYATYSEITDWLRLVNRLNPDITELMEIGTSYNGKSMLLIKIGETRNATKPELWIDGGIHAREWISPATAIYIIHTLVTGYNEDPVISDLLEEFDWYILPVMNPDGYEYSHTTDRMWRKTRSRIPVHRRQCVGVDANRNFDFRWQSECDSNPRCAGRAPCQGVYAGSRPFSEPETIAVANFLLQHKDRMKMYLSLHSYSQLWLLPWAYTRQHPTDYDELVRLSQKAVNSLKAWYNTTYSIGSPAEILYPATGGSYDWAKGVAGIKYSFTMELRDTGNYGFLLPRDQIQPTGLETWAAINKTVTEIRLDTCWMSKTNC